MEISFAMYNLKKTALLTKFETLSCIFLFLFTSWKLLLQSLKSKVHKVDFKYS